MYPSTYTIKKNRDDKMSRFNKVLFCNPPFPDVFDRPLHPHPGLGYLSTFLTVNKIDNDVIDMRFGFSVRDLLTKIDSFKPDLVAITAMTYRYDIVYKLIDAIKSDRYKIVVGGPHASTLKSKILSECKADFAIKLEGEYTLLELCEGKEFGKIHGLIYRDKTKIIENDNRPFIKDLDSISFPTYEKFELEKYGDNIIPIISSRGCPYHCIYCPVGVTMGKQLRVRSAENVVKELSYWYKKGYTRFMFLDDNFTFHRDRVFKICDLIEKERLKNLTLNCPNGIRADKADEELLKIMKEVGFKYIAFGVEAGTNKVLQKLKKGEDIETIEKAIKNACELGYDVGLFFLVGAPSETPSDFNQSIKLALKYLIFDVNFYNIIPFPQTELFNWIHENKYFLKPPAEYLNNDSLWSNEPVFTTPEFTDEERRHALKFAKNIKKHVKKKMLTRKMGEYSIIGKLVAPFIVQITSSNRFRQLVRTNIFLTKFRANVWRRAIN